MHALDEPPRSAPWNPPHRPPPPCVTPRAATPAPWARPCCGCSRTRPGSTRCTRCRRASGSSRCAARPCAAARPVPATKGQGARAARWLGSVAPGDRCHVLGPRRSMDLAAIDRSTVFVGDETSLGLALALCGTPLGGLDTHFIFEVGDALEVRGVIEAMGRGMLQHAWLVERRDDG